MAELEIKPTWGQQLRVLTLLIAGTVLLAYLCFLLIGGSADLFARKAAIAGYVPDATGIGADSEVRLSGIVIGAVTKVEISGSLDPAKAVRIDMRVASRYLKSMPADSQVGVGSDTVVGYKFIGITQGKSTASLQDGGSLQSVPIKQALFRADLIGALQQDLNDLDKLVRSLGDQSSPLGHFVMGSEEYDTVVERVRGFDDALHTFLMPKSDLGQAFYTLQLYDDIRAKVTKTDQMLEAIQRGDGAAGRAFASDEQYETLVRQLTDLHQVLSDANEGKGKLARLLTSDEDWRRLNRLLRATDQTMSALNRGQGRAGELLASPQLYESLTGSLRSLAELLKQLRENPGSFEHYKLF